MKFSRVLLLTVLGCPAFAQEAAPFKNDDCDTTIIRYVHDPARLEVKEKCIMVTGRVTHKDWVKDGDMCMRIKLDKPYRSLLNDRNRKAQRGKLVAEIVCAGRVTRKEAISGCSQYSNRLKIPRLFQRVRIYGVYVLDAPHGWMEIHPVTKIEAVK